MATQVQLRRGTTAQNDAFTGAVGEVTVDTDKDTLRVHDGGAAGGYELAKSNLQTHTNIDVNSGTIDGTVIGGSTPAAVTASALTVGTVVYPTSGQLSNRNKIINGAMTIDQRNAGAAVTVNAVGSFFPTDRFFGSGQNTDGVFTLQQSATAPAGFVNSVIATVTTADASIGATQFYLFNHYIEGHNTADLGWGTASAKAITLSFWTRSSLTGTFGGVISNDGQNRSYPFTYAISAADTWEYKTITIAGDTSGTWLTTNGIGIRLHFDLGVGSTYRGTAGAWAGATYLGATGATDVIGTLNATWYVTGVQLEAGDSATTFEHRSFGQELGLCQRYFQVLGGVTNGFPLLQAYGATSDFVAVPISFHETMRATPTLAKVGTWAATNCGQPSFLYASPYGCSMGVSVTSTGLTTSHPNSTDDIATASAEL